MGSIQRTVLLEAKIIPNILFSTVQGLSTQQWKPRPAFQMIRISKFVKDINDVRNGIRWDISSELHNRKAIAIASVSFGLIRRFLEMCSYIHFTHSTASKTIDHAKVCKTTKQLLALNNKITEQRLFELSEMIEVFPRGKFSAHRQSFSVTRPVSTYFFTSHKINRWTSQNSLNDSFLSTTTMKSSHGNVLSIAFQVG